MRYERSLRDLIGDDANGYSRLALMQAMKSANATVDDLMKIGYLGIRDLSPQEINRIRETVAQMPFASKTVKILSEHRGVRFQGQVFGKFVQTDIYHLFKRIEDGQWKSGTTVAEYLGDLRKAISDPEGKIATYFHQGNPVLGFFCQNKIDPSHFGEHPEAYLYIVYSINQHAIITGYQASELTKLSLEGARWIK